MISAFLFHRRLPASRPQVDWVTVSDAELVVAARNRDRAGKEAFVEIVRRHQMAVCAVACSITGRIGLTDDIAQEAFLNAWKGLAKLREPAKLKAWLMRIVHDCAVRAVRREKPHASMDDEAVSLAEAPDPGPDQAMADAEEERCVWSALAGLPENLRTPLVLFYCEGQSVAAVAEALDLSGDAVKQRLSRGRNELRSQVAAMLAVKLESKLEGVLRRVQPPALLVVTVAAGIGLLSAPTVVAGSAFTAGAKASSTTVAATMCTSKTSLAIAALVAAACLPVGFYGARPGMESSPVAGQAYPDAPIVEPLKKSNFSDSALHAEWRRLHAEHGSTADAMPILYKVITDIKDPLVRRVFRVAQIAEWAEVAPEAGLAFFLEKGRDPRQRDQFFNEWLQRDAAAAVGALMHSGPGWESLARSSLVEIAKRVPGCVSEIAARLPQVKTSGNYEVRDAFAIVAAGGLDAARSAAEAITGASREQALAGVATAWAKTDVNAAIAWAKGLPDVVDRDEIIRSALVGLSSTKPGEALDKVNSLPPGGRESNFVSTTGARVLEEAIKTDYDATVAWLAAHPGQLDDGDMWGMVSAVTERLNTNATDFLRKHIDNGSLTSIMPAVRYAIFNEASGQRAAIWEWIKSQPDSDLLRELRTQVINSTGQNDPALAMKFVAGLPAGKEGDESVRAIAASLLTSGQIEWLDGLLARAPERLAQPLIEVAFKYLSDENLGDPQKWIDRLPDTPAGQRALLTAQLASAWAQKTPEEALAWVSALPAGDARSTAVSAAAKAWIDKDSYGASEWITSLPPGPDKDSASASLVRVIAADSPAEAWQWALSMSDPSTRKDTAMYTLDLMQKSDPVTARQWLEAASFTAEEKTEMRTELDNRASPATTPPSTTSPEVR